jgi:hypothetical protein
MWEIIAEIAGEAAGSILRWLLELAVYLLAAATALVTACFCRGKYWTAVGNQVHAVMDFCARQGLVRF